MNCNACGSETREVQNANEPRHDECVGCGGKQGTMYKGDVFGLVKINTMVEQGEADINYFDFTVLGSDGVSRVHGWYRTHTREVLQFG